MIITGGEKVHSIEVENVICSHRDVVEVAVFAVSDDYWGEVVAAAVVPAWGSSPSQEEVIEYCRSRLSAFKVPRKVFFLETLPKTGSGKISKKRLREVFGRRGIPPSEEQGGSHR
jgi:acyl-CoA synthetase (AMP-forming)/AMP-acid ligase II